MDMKKGYFLVIFFFIVSFCYAQKSSTSDIVPLQITQNGTFEKSEEIKGFTIFPNPVSNGILRITTLENAKRTVHIFDVLGKQVLSRTMISQHLNVSRLSSGIYILKVFEKGKVATRKLVVK